MSWQPPNPINQYERVTVAVSLVGHLASGTDFLGERMQYIQDFVRRFTSLRHLEVHWNPYEDDYGGVGFPSNRRLIWDFGAPLKRIPYIQTVTFTVGPSWEVIPTFSVRQKRDTKGIWRSAPVQSNFPNHLKNLAKQWFGYPRDHDAFMARIAQEEERREEHVRRVAARKLRAKAAELSGDDFAFYHQNPSEWKEDGPEELGNQPLWERKEDFVARIVLFQHVSQKRKRAKLENEGLARRRAVRWTAKTTLGRRRVASLDDNRTSRGEDLRIARTFGSRSRSRPVETEEHFVERNPGGVYGVERNFGSRVRSHSEALEEKSAAEFYRWLLDKSQGGGDKRRRLS
ncbi:hypothetical protein EG328_000614 [Venturia inaequalis]|uniref:Uncharacterized protein n=1 Tax=Venturia inaequalis TaxID=5025 RepID=A0A8H3V429_VENIN|nr:hypothetical protein EG328_000614 [Venturia inaequalis]